MIVDVSLVSLARAWLSVWPSIGLTVCNCVTFVRVALTAWPGWCSIKCSRSNVVKLVLLNG